MNLRTTLPLMTTKAAGPERGCFWLTLLHLPHWRVLWACWYKMHYSQPLPLPGRALPVSCNAFFAFAVA